MFSADLFNDSLHLLLCEHAAAAIVIKRVVQFIRKLLDFDLTDDATEQRQPGTAQAVHIFV